jgi:glycosyltransferase involved in cell wall biosynthesis
MSARGTVLVPAHDEAAVIGRCLTTVLGDAAPDELDVLVVSNGSTDGTVEAARRAAPGAEVVDLAEASKTAALRAGFARALPGPVVVVDADVDVPTATVRALLDALDAGAEPLVAAARPAFDLTHCSGAVRRYYRVWTALPYAQRATIGSGVFALNQAARVALGEVPDVTNDDAWVRRSVPAGQRRIVDEQFVVRPARTVRALVARRARVVNGNRQLADRLGPDGDGAGGGDVLAGVRRRDFGPVDAGVFVAVTAAARVEAWRRRRRKDTRWSTDTTSRAVP